MPDNILGEIAYLDDFPNKPIHIEANLGSLTVSQVMQAVQVMVELAMAKQSHWRQSEELSSRVDLLETQMGQVMRLAVREGRFPVIDYVEGVTHTKDIAPLPKAARTPRAMIVFYGLGIFCCVAFASLLALSSLGTTLLHPFLSLLGFVGGLGWLTTAWTDLLVSKREKLVTRIEREEPVEVVTR
jgi:hypothetical protein